MGDEMTLLPEPQQIADLVEKLRVLVRKMMEYDEDYKYGYWENAEYIDGLRETEDGLVNEENGTVIAEYADDYFVNQWTGYSPDDYHGYMYFRTGTPGRYVKVYYEM